MIFLSSSSYSSMTVTEFQLFLLVHKHSQTIVDVNLDSMKPKLNSYKTEKT